MSVTITGKLNKAANEFAAGDSTGFGLRLGQQYYDRETQQKEWTNYEFVVFARAQAQIDFYRQALVEGAIVSVRGGEQRIRSFEGNNGTILSIEILNAQIENVFSGQAPQQGQGQPQQQQAPAPQAQPKSYTPDNPAGAPVGGVQQVPQEWQAYEPTAKCNGATLEQVFRKFKGDLNAAVSGGYLQDSIPF